MNPRIFSSSSERSLVQRAAWDIYRHRHGDLIQRQLSGRYDAATVAKYWNFIEPTRNPLRRISELMSVTYLRPPRLSTPDDPQAAVDIINYCPDLYVTLALVERITNAIGEIFVVPYWDKIQERVFLDLFPPHMVDVELRRCAVESVTIDGYNGEKTKRTWRYSDDGKIQFKDTSENKRSKEAWQTSEFKNFPVVWVSLNPSHSLEKWAVSEIVDLVNGTLQIGEVECFHNSTNMLKSFLQPYAKDGEALIAARETGESSDMGAEVRIGYDAVLPAELGTIQLADPNDPFLATIQRFEADLAASRGISSQAYYQQAPGKDQSDTITEELRQRWRKTTKLFALYEREIHPILLELINTYANKSYDPKMRIDVDYFSPEEANDRSGALDTLKKGIELGVDNRVDFVFKDHPEILTREEAVAYCDENDAQREMWMERMAARNSPKDPTEPANDPAVNGAQGKGAAGPLNPNSLEYQQDANDARSAQPVGA